VTGYPKPKITWSTSIGSLPKNRAVIKGSQLTLLTSTKDDSGIYLCKAENLFDTRISGTIMNAVYLPQFIKKPVASTQVITHSTIVLKCSAKGDPQPVITWEKENGDLPLGRYEIKNGSLILKDLRTQDAGSYVCTATSAGVFHTDVKASVDVFHRDCSEIYKSGERRSGLYTIKPDDQEAFKVFCDMKTDGGGWNVFQRRQDGSMDFYRNWQDYKTGFGNLNGEFWLGNDFIHRLTASKASNLRVELEDWGGTRVYAKYGSFSVGDESDKYRLRVSSYSGSAGDSLAYHSNHPFTTKDRDNDAYSVTNCAELYTGAWWYDSCHHANLNGKYLGNINDNKGLQWNTFRSDLSLKFAEMKLRPN